MEIQLVDNKLEKRGFLILKLNLKKNKIQKISIIWIKYNCDI